MPAVAILGSVDSGHPPYAPTMAIVGNPLFMVNGKPAVEEGLPWLVHTAPNVPPHVGMTIGSLPFTLNGKKICVVGDVLSCGASIASGDPMFNIA